MLTLLILLIHASVACGFLALGLVQNQILFGVYGGLGYPET